MDTVEVKIITLLKKRYRFEPIAASSISTKIHPPQVFTELALSTIATISFYFLPFNIVREFSIFVNVYR